MWHHISTEDCVLHVKKALTAQVPLVKDTKAEPELNQKETKPWQSHVNGIGQYHMDYKWKTQGFQCEIPINCQKNLHSCSDLFTVMI